VKAILSGASQTKQQRTMAASCLLRVYKSWSMRWGRRRQDAGEGEGEEQQLPQRQGRMTVLNLSNAVVGLVQIGTSLYQLRNCLRLEQSNRPTLIDLDDKNNFLEQIFRC
jgi:hypothetical protein